MVRRHHRAAQPFGQMAGGALGHAARVDEHQGGPMLAGQRGGRS